VKILKNLFKKFYFTVPSFNPSTKSTLFRKVQNAVILYDKKGLKAKSTNVLLRTIHITRAVETWSS